MAPLSYLQNANGRRLKRPFTSATVSASSSPERTTGSSIAGAQARKVKLRAEGTPGHASSRGRGLRRLSDDMPSTAGPRMYENHIPSFMSVYGMDSSVMERPDVDAPTRAVPTYMSPLPHRPLVSQQPEEETQAQVLHQHRQSTSSLHASDSTDSSPTTTISTVDSSSLSDPSPSSSPESPITLVPLSPFSGSSFGLESFQNPKMVAANPIRPPLSDERPMTSPSPRKPKNPKSLALNLNSNVENFQPSEPSSPSFIKPPPLKARRKPSLLSLNTGAANKQPLSIETLGSPLGSPSVPTMLQRRSLKHSISTPHMLITPGFGPSGGMTLGDRNPPRLVGTSRLKESNLATNTFTINEDVDQEHPGAAQMATRVPGVSVGGDTFDRPHTGEDAKSPSYPDGPILMHEPSVHLYLEPKVEEAKKFDLVINVAREVRNPFQEVNEVLVAQESHLKPPLDTRASALDSHDTTPSTAASMTSFQTAFEVQPSSSESSPTTPKPSQESKLPEYIHVPWDHNTDVKDELWDLCQTIEARVKEGKKVLVHCQQGASRSATLIIAYGMYIDQDIGATEAYSRAQAKSRWVNPNMSLLFSLNDFKKIIEAKKLEKKEAKEATRQIKHRSAITADALESPATPTRARGNSTPTSATWDKALAARDDPRLGSSPISDNTIRRLADFDFGFSKTPPRNEPKNHIEPLKPSEPVKPEPQQPTESPQLTEPPRSTFGWEAGLLSPRLTDMNEEPLELPFSPTYSTGFGAQQPLATFPPSPFEHPRASFFSAVQQPVPVDEDPRSPPTRGEVAIPRSIDEFL